jgi:hypothetical protein
MKTLIPFQPKIWALALATACAASANAQDSAGDRAFQPIGAGVKPGSLVLGLAFDSLDRRMEDNERVLANGARLSVTYDRSIGPDMTSANSSFAQTSRLSTFSLVSRSDNGNEFAIGVGGAASRYFGAGGLEIGDYGAIASVPALANPYFSLVPSASHAGFSREVGGIRIKFGILTSGLNQPWARQAFDPATLSPALVAGTPRANSHLLEFSKTFDNAAVSLALMRSHESDTYLGVPSGASSFGAGTATNSMHLTGAWLIAPKLALAAQASYGYTPANSSLLNTGATRTNAFSLALVASDRLQPGDRFSVSLLQPIRAYDGNATIDVVTGVDANGVPIHERRSLSTAPAGRELVAEMNYMRPLGKTSMVGWSLAVRRNPDNVVDAPPDKLIALRYLYQF